MRTFPHLFSPLGILNSVFWASETLTVCIYVCVSPVASLRLKWFSCFFVVIWFFPFNFRIVKPLPLIPLRRNKTLLLLSSELFPMKIDVDSDDHLQNWAFCFGFHFLYFFSRYYSHKCIFKLLSPVVFLFLWTHWRPVIFRLTSVTQKWILYIFPHWPLNDESLLPVNNFALFFSFYEKTIILLANDFLIIYIYLIFLCLYFLFLFSCISIIWPWLENLGGIKFYQGHVFVHAFGHILFLVTHDMTSYTEGCPSTKYILGFVE